MPGLLPAATTPESLALTYALVLLAVIDPELVTLTGLEVPPAAAEPPIE